MKTKTKKLLFILILVVSIMAIIITASQIYNISNNDKVIDNNTGGIETDENTPSDIYGTISNSYTLQLYEWQNATSTNIRDYLKYVGDQNENQKGIEFNVELADINDAAGTGGQQGAFADYLSATITFKVDKRVRIGKIYSCDSVDRQMYNRDREDLTYFLGSNNTGIIQRYEFDYDGKETYTVHIEDKSIMTWYQHTDAYGELIGFIGTYYPRITFFFRSRVCRH